MKTRKLLHAFLSLIFLLNISGCITPKAIEYAEKYSPPPTDYREIKKIHPVAFRKKNDIKLCVTLRCTFGICEDENYLLKLKVGSIQSVEKFSDKNDLEMSQGSMNQYFPQYYFPIGKPSKECTEKIANSANLNIPSISIPESILWEYLYGEPFKSKEEIIRVLNEHSEFILSGGNVYALSSLADTPTNNDSILIYLPKMDQNLKVGAIALTGGYHEYSDFNARYFLVPPALVADAALFVAFSVVFVVAVIITGGEALGVRW